MASVSCRWVPAAAWNAGRRDVELLRVLRAVVPSFSHGMSVDDLQVKQLMGGMTNTVLHCSRRGVENATQNVLLRIDGCGTDSLFDRSTGIMAQRVLGALGLAPRILGEFQNGRVEQFLTGSTLTSACLRDQHVSKTIAAALARAHVEATLAIAKPDSHPLMDRLRSWYGLASAACGTRCPRTGVNMHRVGSAFAELEAQLKTVASPLVFAHCDLQHGNLMVEDSDGENKIFLIDYEYALPQCPRGFDLANHFSEWGYDFNAMVAHNHQVEHLPTQLQKEMFCENYLMAQDGRVGWSPTVAEVQSLVAEADAYMPVVNLHWGLWGLFQASQNESSDFDYAAYGAQRINHFFRLLEKPVNLRNATVDVFARKSPPDLVCH